MWNWVAFAVAAVLIPSPIFNLPGLAVADGDGPIKFNSSTVLMPKVRAGGELVIELVEQRVRVCPTMVQRVLIRESDQVSLIRPRFQPSLTMSRLSRSPSNMQCVSRAISSPAATPIGRR
jgi:hypothetical protein